MARAVLLIVLLLGESAFAATWYWRPALRAYGTGAGGSYQDALRYSDEVEAKLRSGDTLYICGIHDNGPRDRSLLLTTSNVMIRFDCPGDPGVILSASRRLTPESWIRGSSGVHYQNFTGAAPQMLDAAGRLAELTRIPGSSDPCRSYHLSAAGVLYYKPCGEPATVYPSGGSYVLGIEYADNVTIVAPYLLNANRLIRIRNASRVRVISGTLLYAIKEAIQMAGSTAQVEIRDLEISHSGVGIFARTVDGEEHLNLRIVGNIIHDIYGTTDGHGIGVQTASDAYIADNTIVDTDGSAIAFYWWGGQHRMQRNVIENNRIIGVRRSGRSTAVASSQRGISFSGDNDPIRPELQVDNEIRYNEIYDTEMEKMYVKATWVAPAGKYALRVRYNHVDGVIRIGTMATGKIPAIQLTDNEGAVYRN